MVIEIVFNNYSLVKGLVPAWGMCAVIDNGVEKILFDTGSDGEVLIENLKRLNLFPESISKVVLSHNHWDHIGGLSELVRKNPSLEIYAPDLDEDLFSEVSSRGARIHIVSDPVNIAPGMRTTGVLSRPVPEQALWVETGRGNVIVTGCSHPGVENLVALVPPPRHLVTGGFHLLRSDVSVLEQTAETLEGSGVEFLAPSHCTGDAALEYFKQYFGERFIYGGLGARFDEREGPSVHISR